MGITEAVKGSQGSAQRGPGPSGGPTSQALAMLSKWLQLHVAGPGSHGTRGM